MNIFANRQVNSPNIDLVVTATLNLTEELTYEAIRIASKELADRIAGEVFKKNKKKIIAALDVDLITAEIQKLVLEKIKKQGLEAPQGDKK